MTDPSTGTVHVPSCSLVLYPCPSSWSLCWSATSNGYSTSPNTYAACLVRTRMRVLISRRSLQALDDVQPHARTSVRHAVFGLQSCHTGNNDLIRAGGQLVTCLSTLFPKLQTLRLWRADDYLWTSGKVILPFSCLYLVLVIDAMGERHGGLVFSTSVRPNLRRGAWYTVQLQKWMASLSTPESIGRCSRGVGCARVNTNSSST